MNKTLLHQTYCNYPLHLHFNSPVGDIFSYGEEISKEIYDTWMSEYKDGEGFYRTAIIMRKIAGTIVANMPLMRYDYNYFDVIIKILHGEMYHEYYSSGPYGEKIFDYLDEVFDHKNEMLPPDNILIQADDAWTKAITQYLIPIKGTHLYWGDEKGQRPNEYWITPKTNYKISKRGIEYVKKNGYDESIVKGLKEIYVRRWYRTDLRILDAIISYVYFEKELFLYFHPHQFELGICDKEHFEFQHSGAYMVIDFGKVINNVFCDDCIEKLRKNSKIKGIKFDASATGQEREAQTDVLLTMFKSLYEVAVNEHFDDVILTMRGEVDNPNRYHELDNDTRFGNVGFTKYDGKKVGVWAETTKTLKGTRKSLKKK